MTIKTETLKTVLKKFSIYGEILKTKEMNSGHINDTLLVKINNNNKVETYIIQKINTKLFKNYKELMNNILLVTEHIRNKMLKNKENPNRYCLNFLKSNNKPYVIVDNEVYRGYIFIDNSITYSTLNDPKIFYKSALAFANFAKNLDDFDVLKIFDIIPDFHNTESRYKDFENALNNAIIERKEKAKEEINFAIETSYFKDIILASIKTGSVPLRVTHNDTKLNNVLIDKDTKEALAVIDLDTVMKGSILYDFGDSIRFGCNSAAEDEQDLDKVHFRIDYFEEYVKGYIEILGNKLTNREIELLHISGIVMTYECGIRFLTDYLTGDTYFKISRKNHNLDRARTQFKLVKEMIEHQTELRNIVRTVVNSK